jgi:(p)ppGpp synthase/HD superfamily hydrolase
LPYIVHPYAVAFIVASHGADEDTIVAALLHDCIEDVEEFNYPDVERLFGKRVADIVHGVTEEATRDTKDPWIARKESYIARLRTESAEAKLVCAADKLNNLESIRQGAEDYGAPFLESFNASAERQIWFFESVLYVLEETFKHPIVGEYRKVYDEVSMIMRRHARKSTPAKI